MTHSEVVGLRTHLEKLMDERDRRYTERAESDQRAVNAALAAAEKAVTAALAAAEKAAEKFEQALKEYKVSSNDLRAALNDIVTRMLPRADFEREHKSSEVRLTGIDRQIADLRESRSKGSGKDEGLELAKANQRMIVGIGVPILLALLGIAVEVLLG